MHERFIARQPIFDKRLQVFAYELLFRRGPENFSSLTATLHPASSPIPSPSLTCRLLPVTPALS